MKRIGYLYEQMMTKENFVKAEILLGKNKPKNKKAKFISHNAEYFAEKLFQKVEQGYEWHKPRLATITDTYKGKTRNLKIPCLEDQAAQLVWLNIATPHIERRNYYYNCGSIPKAGQSRCVNALKKWLKNPKYKYGAVLDIRKFYDTCPHWLVRKGLERIFKDQKFIDFAMGFVASMSDNDVGLAIGYPCSHWLANVALSELDHELKREFPDIKYTRYMDDIAMISGNKRKLRKAINFILASLAKRLMFRISKRMRRISKISRHIASGVMSYLGILSHCNSYNFRLEHVYPYVNISTCAKAIRRRHNASYVF